MEILVLGDSLTFGRPKYNIYRKDTWPYLLADKLNCSVAMLGKGGANIKDVYLQSESLNYYWFNSKPVDKFYSIFVQVGICGVCPRLVPKYLNRVACKIPGFHFLQRQKIAYSIVGRPWISDKNYLIFLSKLLNNLEKMSDKIFFIQTTYPAHYLKENIGDFSSKVKLRNDILEKTIGTKRYISCWEKNSINDYLLPDGYHLNALGHKRVLKKCLEKFRVN